MFSENLRKLRRKFQYTQPELAKCLHVSNGTIAMWETDKRTPDAVMMAQIAKFFNVSVDFLLGMEKRDDTVIKIPVLGSIPAGIPLEAISDIIDYEEIPQQMAKSGEFFALKVRGDSMAPSILDGDIVIIRKQEDAESGKVCVVMINGNDATLKEIKKEREGIWVLPRNANSEFKPRFYSNEDVETLPVRILGVAVEIRRSI